MMDQNHYENSIVKQCYIFLIAYFFFLEFPYISNYIRELYKQEATFL